MSYIFVTFSSRTASSRAYNLLRQNGIVCQLFSTPRQVSMGCGLSVRFSPGALDLVRSLIDSSSPSFVGFFRLTLYGERRIIVRI